MPDVFTYSWLRTCTRMDYSPDCPQLRLAGLLATVIVVLVRVFEYQKRIMKRNAPGARLLF